MFTDKPLPIPEKGILQADFVTSIPEEVGPGDWTIYPNPAFSQVEIALPQDMKEASYRILDMTGRVVLDGNKGKDQAILGIDLEGIRPGIYIFEAFDAKRVLHKRFIKL